MDHLLQASASPIRTHREALLQLDPYEVTYLKGVGSSSFVGLPLILLILPMDLLSDLLVKLLNLLDSGLCINARWARR